ncbi:MAG: ribosome biogenesis GTP-binding protein YihA/YsxC [Selenomonas sp.]|uniref:ribosome biogenesis GTP-binding protein YihA/YsxC n=2 Tax=Selenomonas sp. TaxID=2053611 RepID=UPI0025F645C9|nr:ribosome biogenesis GTP-binding protein YihA/YsxC [Selenomonas sp.]MCI6085374.1 ribosome biogenesis GTP-binding protein YihA/YsxC [Selenomonas sp.]
MEAQEVIITQASYLASAVNPSQYPVVRLPEFVFIGRSNVGKSSLINSLTRVKNLARVSSQPGKTQTINFYELGAKRAGADERKNFYLVDLPGYGYAKTAKGNRKIWAKFIEEYLTTSKELQFVCQLIDIRHAPMASDIDMFRWLVARGIPVLVIATKADKLGKTAREKQVRVIKQALGVPELSVLPYSSLKNEGRSDLLDVLGDALLQ